MQILAAWIVKAPAGLSPNFSRGVDTLRAGRAFLSAGKDAANSAEEKVCSPGQVIACFPCFGGRCGLVAWQVPLALHPDTVSLSKPLPKPFQPQGDALEIGQTIGVDFVDWLGVELKLFGS